MKKKKKKKKEKENQLFMAFQKKAKIFREFQ